MEDNDLLNKMFGVVGKLLPLLKDSAELNPGKKQEVEKAIKKAEEELDFVKAMRTKELGYELCYRHDPPETMLTIAGNRRVWECPKCGDEKSESPGIVGGPGRPIDPQF